HSDRAGRAFGISARRLRRSSPRLPPDRERCERSSRTPGAGAGEKAIRRLRLRPPRIARARSSGASIYLTGFSEKGYILRPMIPPLPPLAAGDADTMDKGSEANVGAERVQAGIDLDVGETLVADLEGAFEPFKRFVVFLKSGVNQRDFIAADAGSID